MPDIFVSDGFYHGTTQACIVDVTPPTFSGINFLDVESRGQIRAGWAAGSDVTLPVRYEIYIQASTATGLFSFTNIAAITDKLMYDIFTLPDGSSLVNGTTYYVGVRAIDGVGNRDGNVVSQSVISTGVLTSIDVYETKAAWSSDGSNMFRVTAWANKNESLAKAPNAILGTASYQIFDKLGNPVVGMSGSGIIADSEGLYVFPAVSDQIITEREHYEMKLSIIVDGEARVNMVRLEAGPEQYSIDGISDATDSGLLTGSFWVSENEKIVTSGLSAGAYQAYTASGTLIPGLSETGIIPNPDGFFTITPFLVTALLDNTASFIIRLTATVNGQILTKQIILGNDPALYTNKAVFSINASNQFKGTFWAVKNDILLPIAALGTASYQIYDAAGVPVPGMSESGIVADSGGMFHITPISATPITDLTHYMVKVTVKVANIDRVTIKSFTLLGN